MNSKSPSNNDNQNDNISTSKIRKNKENNINDIKSLVESTTTSYLSNFLNNTNKTSNRHNIESPKSTKSKYLLSFEKKVQKDLKEKYNYSNSKYELLCINHLLRNSSCRMVSIFKERMILDYIDEFLKRIYNIKESKERIPKFYLYYKHYSIFFGQPFFTNFDLNLLLQKNGEKKARIYYKNQYQNGESKDDDNENGFAESGSDDEEEKGKNNEEINKKKKNNNNNIFSSDIKETIDNVTLMTTINSIENNTINLGLNNEKIEIFSENKKERSNDTTIGEIVEDINKGIEKVNNAKNKNTIKKKKKKSLGENNVVNEDIKKNKKKLMELINNNNLKKNIKNNSIKKKLFYIRHQNANLNSGGNLISNTHRYSQKKNVTSIKNENLSKNNNYSNTNNISSNKTYKKRRLLSYGNEEINKIINPNSHKSPKHSNNLNINFNYLNTITTDTIYRSKNLNHIKKINNPFSMNKKSLNMNNNTNAISSLSTNRNINKIKICKTLKSFGDKNKIKKNDIRNLINKDMKTISGDKKKKLNKISYKKFGFSNLTETQILTEKNNIEKIKGRNIISPLNDKHYENYTLNNNYININNMPFSANKNKNCLNNGKNINNNILLNNLSYENINYDKGIYHKRTKSNLLQNNFKSSINDNPVFSKVNIRNTYNAYVKPSIRINKNEKLFINKPIEPTDSNYLKNQTSINNYYYNELKNKKLTTSNDYYLNNLHKNNQNLINDSKNNVIQNNDQAKNSNFNKYVLDAIKKSRHQHCNSLSNQINPFHTLNANDDIFKNKDTLKNLNKKGQKVRDVLQIALSLFVNENTSRNYQNNVNVMEKYPTYYKLNKNPTQKNDKNNPKRNYNLNININNEININENNIINNSTYLINDINKLNSKTLKRKTMDKNISKNYIGNDSKQREKDKNIVNLKQKKYNIDQPISSSSNNICKLTKNSINDNNRIISSNTLNNKKTKKMKSRNYEGGNLNNVLTSINNNYLNTVILNNNTFDNDKSSYKNKVNNTFNRNKNIIKSYHTKNGKSLFLFNGP